MRTQYSSGFVLVLAIGALAALVTQGCAQKAAEEPMQHTALKVPTETLEPKAENEPGAVATAKEELERTLNQKLEQLDEEIRELQSRVAKLKDKAKAEWAEKMAELDAKRKKAGEKLDEIRKSTGEAWEHLREGADTAWEELERSVKAAVKEF